MTKEPVPVCGAKTRAGTSCQNTLVTGCGRCPVHASQLRAAAAGVKPVPRSRSRKKKQYRPATPSSSALTAALAADGLLDTPREQPFQDPSLGNFGSVVGANMFGTVQDAFATPLQPGVHDVREGVDELDVVLRKERVQNLDSPVTPATEENVQQRFEYIYPGDSEGGADDSMPSVDVLQQEHDYLDSQLKVNFDELCNNL